MDPEAHHHLATSNIHLSHILQKPKNPLSIWKTRINFPPLPVSTLSQQLLEEGPNKIVLWGLLFLSQSQPNTEAILLCIEYFSPQWLREEEGLHDRVVFWEDSGYKGKERENDVFF